MKTITEIAMFGASAEESQGCEFVGTSNTEIKCTQNWDENLSTNIKVIFIFASCQGELVWMKESVM